MDTNDESRLEWKTVEKLLRWTGRPYCNGLLDLFMPRRPDSPWYGGAVRMGFGKKKHCAQNHRTENILRTTAFFVYLSMLCLECNSFYCQRSSKLIYIYIERVREREKCKGTKNNDNRRRKSVKRSAIRMK